MSSVIHNQSISVITIKFVFAFYFVSTVYVIVYPLSTMTLWRDDCLTPIHKYWVRTECHSAVIANHEYTQTIWCICCSPSPTFKPRTPTRNLEIIKKFDALDRSALIPLRCRSNHWSNMLSSQRFVPASGKRLIVSVVFTGFSLCLFVKWGVLSTKLNFYPPTFNFHTYNTCQSRYPYSRTLTQVSNYYI